MTARGAAVLIVTALVQLGLSGCTFSSESLEFERGEKAALAGRNDDAVKHFRAVIDRASHPTRLSIQSAREAARISRYELRRFSEAITHYKYVILNSEVSAERIAAEKEIADIYFSQTQNYEQAIIEYSRLLALPHTSTEEAQYRMAIARSYFYKNSFFQSQTEIDRILSGGFSKTVQFDARLLKANIFLTTKQLDEAVKELRELMAQDPDRAKDESIGLLLAICYEEQKNFVKAIEVLESIKVGDAKREFIENKIRTLRERQSYLPGARGLKK